MLMSFFGVTTWLANPRALYCRVDWPLAGDYVGG